MAADSGRHSCADRGRSARSRRVPAGDARPEELPVSGVRWRVAVAPGDRPRDRCCRRRRLIRGVHTPIHWPVLERSHRCNVPTAQPPRSKRSSPLGCDQTAVQDRRSGTRLTRRRDEHVCASPGALYQHTMSASTVPAARTIRRRRAIASGSAAARLAVTPRVEPFIVGRACSRQPSSSVDSVASSSVAASAITVPGPNGGGAHLAQLENVGRRDHAANDDHDVRAAQLGQRRSQLGDQGEMSGGQRRHPDHVHVAS
jgi:hypothetical protein